MKAGSIDGTDTEPHDKAVSRAMQAHYKPPHGLKSKPERTLFVARLGPKITKHDLREVCFYCIDEFGLTVHMLHVSLL